MQPEPAAAHRQRLSPCWSPLPLAGRRPVQPVSGRVQSAQVMPVQVMSVEDARRFLRGRPPPHAALQEAERSRRAGKLEAAFLLAKWAAQNGSPEAMFQMGRRFDPETHTREGVVKKPDLRAALLWYLKAARERHIGAMLRLGTMFENGMIGEDVLEQIIEQEGDIPPSEMDSTEWALYWLEQAAKAKGMKQ